MILLKKEKNKKQRGQTAVPQHTHIFFFPKQVQTRMRMEITGHSHQLINN